MFDRRLALTGAALAAVVMVTVAAVTLLPGGEDTVQLQESVSDIGKAESRAREYAYLLKEHDGRIGVFLQNEKEPEMVLDVLVKYLPDFDRQQLAAGIPAATYEELVALIEDYSS